MDFSWQAGYGLFSANDLQAETLTSYIRNQAEHHKTMSFQDEFRKLLEEHNVSWNEQFVWD